MTAPEPPALAPSDDTIHCWGAAMTGTCTPVTLYVGPEGCAEGDCDEYVTAEGEPTGIERCTHLRETQYCGQHSVETSYGDYDPAEPWPCKHMPAE